MANTQYLRNVPLPEGLTNQQIFDALQNTENFFKNIRETSGIALSSHIQSNNFSGVVSNVFSKMLDNCSDFKQYKDDRYPDNKHQISGLGLEVKASNKPLKGGEGHNGHSGWHIIVCFELSPEGDPHFVHVEIAELIGFGETNSDWKYQGSSRNDNNSQRTETYITTAIGTAKLRDGSVYLNTEKVSISDRMKTLREKLSLGVEPFIVPEFSPLKK